VQLPGGLRIDRTELVRVVADALDALGLPSSSASVLAEARALTAFDGDVARLCTAIEAGRWLDAAAALQALPGMDPTKRARAHLVLLQERFVQCVLDVESV